MNQTLIRKAEALISLAQVPDLPELHATLNNDSLHVTLQTRGGGAEDIAIIATAVGSVVVVDDPYTTTNWAENSTFIAHHTSFEHDGVSFRAFAHITS